MALDDLQRNLVSSLRGVPQQGDHLGHTDALVTLTYWGDLQCQHCRDFTTGHLMELVRDEVQRGILDLRFRPLRTVTRDARGFEVQHAASWAAGRQGRMWEFMEGFFLSQQEANTGYVTDRFLRALADEIPGLDLDQWEEDRRAHPADLLADAEHDARAAGVAATPGLVLTHGAVALGPLAPDVNAILDGVDRLLG